MEKDYTVFRLMHQLRLANGSRCLSARRYATKSRLRKMSRGTRRYATKSRLRKMSRGTRRYATKSRLRKMSHDTRLYATKQKKSAQENESWRGRLLTSGYSF